MDLLKLRILEGRVLLKTIEEEPFPDTVLVARCDKTLLMQSKHKNGKQNYILQTSVYAKGSFVTYKCNSGQNPCCALFKHPFSGPSLFDDGENLPSYNWEQIESGSVPFKDLPPLFLIYLKSL